jgi:hypothetical protein
MPTYADVCRRMPTYADALVGGDIFIYLYLTRLRNESVAELAHDNLY